MSEFVGTEEEVKIPQCHSCVHYHLGGMSCLAFLSIPIDIYMNKYDHKESYPGDNGIQFEPIKELANA